MNNKILSILNDYLSWQNIEEKNEYREMSNQEKDNLRIKYDKDAKYYYEKGFSIEKSLHADTIISFWQPYKRLVEL